MKSLEYYRVDCPKCHGPLNCAAPLSGETICPFCGTLNHITANMTMEDEMPEQIIPFATSDGDFVQSARNMLVEQEYAPVNISELISFKGVKGIYLPVYLYEGQYECSWSCRMKQTVADTGDAQNKKEVYRQQTGISKGEYSMVCLAFGGVATDKELSEYVRSLDVRGDDIQPFLADRLSGCLFLTRNREAQSTWKQQGKEALNKLVRNNTLMQLRGNDLRDFKCNITSHTSPEGRFIFFPVWMIQYQHEGESHHIFMDGTGRNGVRGTTLTDRTLKAKAEKPFTTLKYIAVAAIVIPFLMLLTGWYLPAIIALIALGLVFFGYRYYARWHRSRVIRKARKERGKFIVRNS